MIRKCIMVKVGRSQKTAKNEIRLEFINFAKIWGMCRLICIIGLGDGRPCRGWTPLFRGWTPQKILRKPLVASDLYGSDHVPEICKGLNTVSNHRIWSKVAFRREGFINCAA